MGKKQRVCKIVLSICAMIFLEAFYFPAWAAPVRDKEESSTLVTERTQRLVNLIASAAMVSSTPSLDVQEVVPLVLQEASFALSAFTENESLQVVYTEQECRNLYRSLYRSGDFIMPEEPGCPCVTVQEDTLIIDLEQLNEMPLYGVSVYHAWREEDRLWVEGDVYSAYGFFGTIAENIPEDALNWVCSARFALYQDPETPCGCVVEAFSMSDPYRGGDVRLWRETDFEDLSFSCLIPDFLTLRDPEERIYASYDDAITLTIFERTPEGLNRSVLEWFSQEHAGGKILSDGTNGYFESIEDEEYTFMIATGEPQRLLCFTLAFSPQDRTECVLYAQLIRNSICVWGYDHG